MAKFVVELRILHIEADDYNAAMDQVEEDLAPLYGADNILVEAAWIEDSNFTWKD